MNHDGTVTITGKQKKGWLEQVMDFAGKFLPVLAAIPGLGLVAIAAKVVTVFNAVRSFAQSLKTGNLLGMVGSAASVVVKFSQGAFQAFASKVANLANVGQQVITTLKHGLGNGLLQVVSNGANLVSGIAQAAADLGQGGFQSGATNVAQLAGNVGGYAGGVDRALKEGDLTPLATQVAGTVVQEVKKNNTAPQVQKPVANPPSASAPFSGNAPAGTEYSVSTQPIPSLVTPPDDKDPNDWKDSNVKDPKKQIGKDLSLDENDRPYRGGVVQWRSEIRSLEDQYEKRRSHQLRGTRKRPLNSPAASAERTRWPQRAHEGPLVSDGSGTQPQQRAAPPILPSHGASGHFLAKQCQGYRPHGRGDQQQGNRHARHLRDG